MLVEQMNYAYYSFDVFDTLVTRKTARPNGIFCIIQEKLKKAEQNLPADLVNNFMSIRASVEHFVRLNVVLSGISQDIRLDDIYNRLATNYHLSEDEVAFLKKLEMETELENWVLIEENVSLIKELKKKGKKIILVSDMYIPEDILKKFLSKLDEVFKDIPVYVSGDRKLTKHFGDLYDLVATQEGIVNRSLWLHIGDNQHADVNMARKKGLKSIRFAYPALTGYEERARQDDLFTQLLVGQGKLMRLKPQHKNFVFASSFVAPLLYQYVYFVIDQSLRRGITHLYFVARDGFILRLIADEIIAARGLTNLHTHYFYASRASIRIPNPSTIHEFLDTSLYETEVYTSPKEKDFMYRFAGFSNIPLDIITKHFTSNHSLKKNLHKKAFVEDVLAEFQHRQNLLISYFKQEVPANTKFAFVDLEGSGRSMNLLASILGQKFPCFYYLLVPPAKSDHNFEAIVFSHRVESEPQILELFCRYWEGQCIGYREEKGKIVPVLDMDLKAEFERWGWTSYVQGIQQYSRQLGQYLATSPFTFEPSAQLGWTYLDWLVDATDNITAEILGSIPWSNLGQEKDAQAAPALSLKGLLKRYYFQEKGKKKLDFDFLSEKRTSSKTKLLASILCPITVRKSDSRKRIYLWNIKIASFWRKGRKK